MWIKKWFIKLRHHRDYEELIFIHFLLWVTIPVIVMGGISYYVYIQGESAKSNMMLESYSRQVFENYDNTFTSLREYYLDAVNRDSFKWLVQQEDLPYQDFQSLKKAKELLQGNNYVSGYVKTYNFINLKMGWVMNNYGTLWYKELKNLNQVNDFLEEQKSNPNFLYWLNRADVKSPYEDLIGSSYIDVSQNMLIVKSYDYIGNLEYMLIIQLDFSKLDKTARSYQNIGYDIAVMVGKETLIQTNTDIAEMLMNIENSDSGIYLSNNDERYRLSVSPSLNNGLQYVVGYNTNRNKKYAAAFLLIALIIIPAYGLFLLLMRYATRRLAKPFKILQSFTADQNLQIRELLVSNLIKGELNDSKITFYTQKYGVTRFKCYRLIVIRCKHGLKNDEITEKDLTENGSLESQLLETLPKEISGLFFIVPVIYERAMVVLVGDEDEEKLDLKAAYAFKRLKDYADEKFSCQIATGISKSFEKLSCTDKAYQECLEVLNHRHKDKNESTLALYDDYALMRIKDNAYDNSIEKELCDAIENCNQEESERLLSLILKRMEPAGLWGVERNFYLNRLIMEILSIPVKESILLSGVLDDGHYNVMNRASKIYDIQELETYIMDEIMIPVIEALKIHRQSKETEIVRKVTLLIRESKGDITLSECAEALNYHPSYLSRVIKIENGMNFSDIVNGEKIKLAKYMLLTTCFSISEISDRLNYNNVQNFIRFFKNQVGVTPARFRKNIITESNQ